MSEYQLQIKQVVDYPRCRIYRQFVQSLITDQSIRTGGGSGLFYYTVLCSYANFRTSYRRIDGISYTVYPGEWICTVKELAGWFRTHFQHQALAILDELQTRNLISYLPLGRGKVQITTAHARRTPDFSFCRLIRQWSWWVPEGAARWISCWICGCPQSITMGRCRVQSWGLWCISATAPAAL